MEENKRDSWGSNFGFLLAAVGSAVGLGNIWGFPYKMGKNGGGAFLIIYLALIVIVGLAVMLGELVIGRKTGMGPVGAYKKLSKKYALVGYMGLLSGFLILSFYSVLGGMVGKYMISFLISMLSGGSTFNNLTSAEFFSNFTINGWEMLAYCFLFLLATTFIVMKGISNGIEKFTKVAMPALAVLLIVIITFVLCQDGAVEGLKFMFKPDFSVYSSSSDIGFFTVLKTAAGQMFFSLSLGMGCMITYGSYLKKNTNLEKNAIIIPIADTFVAIMAGMVVMPAVFAYGLEPSAGPSLLFISLHEVFVTGMGGFIGSLMGFLFYLLVFIAAITSSISLLEVCSSFINDKKQEEHKKVNRKLPTIIISLMVFVIGVPVALDGLGSSNAIINFQPFGYCWLDFYDLISEGILMPIGALIMSLIIGWGFKTKIIKTEIEEGGLYKLKGFVFWDICFKIIVPITMLIILYAQFQDFGIIK